MKPLQCGVGVVALQRALEIHREALRTCHGVTVDNGARPPVPFPVTVTVVSPPATTQQGLCSGFPSRTIFLARAPNRCPSFRATPVKAGVCTMVRRPASLAAWVTAVTAAALFPTI